MAEAHGGRLHAASAGIGLGSTFSLELPTILPPVAEEPAPADDEEPVAADHLRILLVEDNRDSLKNLTWALDRLGHSGVPADCLAAARAAATWGDFDVLISDIQLPDGTGLELMQEAGRSGEAAGIALSGYGSEEDVRESLAAGFREHLTKPITFTALDAAIRRVAPGRTRGGRAVAIER